MSISTELGYSKFSIDSELPRMIVMKLKKCGEHISIYTLKDKCECRQKTHSAHPAKFSERYGKYRRLAKTEAKKI